MEAAAPAGPARALPRDAVPGTRRPRPRPDSRPLSEADAAADRPRPSGSPRARPAASPPAPARTVKAGTGDEAPPGRPAAHRLPAEQRPLQLQRHLLGPTRHCRRQRLQRAGHGVRRGRQVGRERPGAGGNGQHGGDSGSGAGHSCDLPGGAAVRMRPDVTLSRCSTSRQRRWVTLSYVTAQAPQSQS